MAPTSPKKSPLAVIFITVFLDLIGFGIIIPLIGIYGKNFGATTAELALLGSIYSIMQFFFAPIWGKWSDHHGRRPMMLISLAGSVLSYYLFAFAQTYWLLVLSRALAGTFAANISTAQAYIADITTPKDRAKGMGLIGAAFGIGFTLGPPLGGLSATHLGLAAPGLIAGSLCLLNLILASVRLPETLSPETMAQARSQASSQNRFTQLTSLFQVVHAPVLKTAIFSVFFATFSFSIFEQVFPLFIQNKLLISTQEAAHDTGMLLMLAGFIGIIVQGGLIRKWVPKYGEHLLLVIGFLLQGLAMLFFIAGSSYLWLLLGMIPLAFGSGLINPSLSAIVSKNAADHEQGKILGIKESMSSLARIFGPLIGFLAFGVQVNIPFILAGITLLFLMLTWIKVKRQPS